MMTLHPSLPLLYFRELFSFGKTSTAPRSKSIPDNNILNFPTGQRSETTPPHPLEANHFFPQHGFRFMGQRPETTPPHPLEANHFFPQHGFGFMGDFGDLHPLQLQGLRTSQCLQHLLSHLCLTFRCMNFPRLSYMDRRFLDLS